MMKMPEKMLYEFVAQFSVLIVNDEEEVESYLGKENMVRFKKLHYALNLKESLDIYEKEHIDLVVINIDRLGRDSFTLIDAILKKDIYQRIIVSGRRLHESAVLIELSNAGVAGFINKSMELAESYEMFLRIFRQISDRALLVHYIDALEKQTHEALSIPCRVDCPKATILSKHIFTHPIQEVHVTSLVEEVADDDFDFFPTPSHESTLVVEKSMYNDYFSFLQNDDYEELHDQLSDIDTFFFSAFNNKYVDTENIVLLGQTFSRFGNVLMHYQFFSDTGMVIIELGTTIADKYDVIGSRGNEFEPLISGFCSVLQTFICEVWAKEAENPKFFNDSIINDARMIISMIIPPVASASSNSDDDLIFF